MTLRIEKNNLVFTSREGERYTGAAKHIIPVVKKYIPESQLNYALQEMEKKSHTLAAFGVLRGEFLFTKE